ncbi:MAG: hypothetical protein HYR64_00190 [Fimbriimonas ginsengisoli]|uniref:HD domain-containing protein n=1 Tax=Fimbriimonas ginsengisoli TaxID=1005039 RepID=A0A931LQC0_FIMGI|nr:hypothetical protein [Fimbriimonas ginsengisoli]
MDALSFAILAGAGLTTVWLLWYTHRRLPAELDERMRDSLQAFSKAIELRFPAFEGVGQRVRRLAVAVGREMRLDRPTLRRLELAATLRDIGLCAIPYALVNEIPEPDWTKAERATFERHPEVSAAMLEMTPSLRELAPIVRWHHASYDGSDNWDHASPVGNALPVEARVLKVVSDYVRLERRMGDLLARERLREGFSLQYDPLAGYALLRVLTSARAGDRERAVGVS